MKKYLLASVAAVAGVAMSTAAFADIVIATAGPMTGQYASFGAQMKAGAEQAVADINAAGGVNGRKIELLKEDSVNPQTASTKAERMIERDKVALIHIGADDAYRVDGRPVRREEMADVLAGLTGRGKTEAVVVVREGARTMDLAAGLALIRRQAFSSVRVVE